jgi:CheY-like chemotaxis protein
MTTHASSHEVPDQFDPSKVAGPLEHRRVLFVEDCPDQQRLYTCFLERVGAEVILECNGDAALETVARSSRTFDAVVMDLDMPEMDGIQTTRILREHGFAGAIIAVTAYGSQETRRRWLDAGCDVYLEKPLSAQMIAIT